MTSTLLLLLSLSASALRIAPAYHLSAAPTAAIARCRVATVCMADDDPDPKGVVNDASEKFSKSVSSVAESLSTLRIGKASASMLDRVMVDYYGAETPLNQLAMVTTPTATQLVVDPFDKSCMGDVEKALMNSDIGMTPNSDGKVIRLNVPQLTGERRTELSKTAKALGEDGKTAIRNVRKTAMDKIKKMKKAIGEDSAKDFEDQVQKAVKKAEGEVEKLVSEREKEILTV